MAEAVLVHGHALAGTQFQAENANLAVFEYQREGFGSELWTPAPGDSVFAGE